MNKEYGIRLPDLHSSLINFYSVIKGKLFNLKIWYNNKVPMS